VQILVAPTTQFEEVDMCREAFDQCCPWALLAKQGALVCPYKAQSSQSDRGLNEQLEKYFASGQSRTSSLRDSLFFHFYPALLKILGRYCHPRAGCHKYCFAGDLLSDMYIAFAEYLDQFDASRHVSFMNYMIKKLSWRAFNSFAREHRVRTREVLWNEEKDDVVDGMGEPNSPENSLIVSLDLEKYLSRMQSATRNLCLLHYFEGYSYSELATMESRHETAIRKAVSRACRKFRKAYSFDQRHAFEHN
jgi:RNA polymerase sigma factor (sigma-70 family)